MIEGVKNGFEKKLEIEGIGYKAALQGKDLVLSLGYSHPVNFKAMPGIEFKVEKNTIIVSGIDKELVGQVAANIRKLRKPEPYKGKGIRYQGEVVKRKAGKKVVKSGF
jgi:large subunit ribosomal protein L6